MASLRDILYAEHQQCASGIPENSTPNIYQVARLFCGTGRCRSDPEA
jgi:hypothetical protein